MVRDNLTLTYAELEALTVAGLDDVAGSLMRAIENVRAGDAIDGGRAYAPRSPEQADKLIQDLSNAQRVVFHLMREKGFTF